MIIGIDASRSIDSIKKTGVEKVSDGLIKQLLTLTSEHKVIFYTPQHIDWLPLENQGIIKGKKFWTILRLSIEMFKSKPEVYFSPVHELPFFIPRRTYRFIHDIAFLKNKSAYGFIQRNYLNFGLKRSKNKCLKVFVSTQIVKNDLERLAGFAAEQIVVTGLGYDPKNNERDPEEKNQIIYIGRIETKKNISNLLAGFEIFSKNNPRFKLIMIGKPGHGFGKIKSLIDNNSQVEYMGFVSDQAKYKLLRQSTCLAHLPHEEGFSYPLLEAFDFKLPVLASDIPTLKEVGGDSCLYVDAKDKDEIAKGMTRLVNDKELRLNLIAKGKARLDRYSWLEVANKISKYLLNNN